MERRCNRRHSRDTCVPEWVRIKQVILILLSGLSLIYSQSLYNDRIKPEFGSAFKYIYSLTQDKRGRLWIGTNCGLGIYDGNQFSVIDTNNGLNNNEVWSLFENEKGVMWIGSKEGLYTYYNDHLTNIPCQSNEQPGILKIDEDQDGRIWLGTTMGIYTCESTSLERLEPGPVFKNEKILTFALCSPDSSIWAIPYGKGVYRLKGYKWSYYSKKDGLVSDTVTNFYENPEGRIYFAHATNKKISIWDGQYFTGQRLFDKSAKGIYTFVEDKRKNLWIGTNDGLFVKRGEKITEYTSIRNGLPEDFLYAAYCDKRGDLWFGTIYGDLFRVPAEQFESYSAYNGLPENNIYSILKDKNDNLWYGVIHKGIFRIDAAGNITNFSKNEGIKSIFFPDIKEDNYGDLWFASFNGVFRYRNGKFSNYSTVTKNLKNDIVWELFFDSEENIWIGKEGGVVITDRNFTDMQTIPGLDSVISSSNVQHIFEDQEGFSWISTDKAGVIKSDRNNIIEIYDKNSGLPTNDISQTLQDKSGDIWFLTNGSGIIRYDGENFSDFTMKDGLPGDFCYTAEEYNGFLFIGTSRGISRFQYNAFEEKGKYAFRNYSDQDGIVSNECNTGAIFTDKEGYIYFGTMKGITCFHPVNIPVCKPSPVKISKIRIYDNDSFFDTLSSEQILLNYNNNSIQINYSATDFISKDSLTYYYQLPGYHDGWVKTRQNSVFLVNLSAAEYSFSVKCINSDGIWSKPASFDFVIRPPFWQTWWFRIIASIGIAALLAIIPVIRFRRLKEKKRIHEIYSGKLIESQEAERKRIASELHDSLSQNLLLINNELQQFQINSNNDAEEVNQALDLVKESIRDVREISTSLHPDQLDKLGFKRCVEGAVNKISHATGIKFGMKIQKVDNILPAEKEIHLYRIIQEALNNIIKHSGAKKAEMIIEHTDHKINARIKDYGKGFDISGCEKMVEAGIHFGLYGMEDRVNLIGGSIKIESKPEAGTIVSVSVPLEN